MNHQEHMAKAEDYLLRAGHLAERLVPSTEAVMTSPGPELAQLAQVHVLAAMARMAEPVDWAS